MTDMGDPSQPPVPITLDELVEAVKGLALLQMEAGLATQDLIRSLDRPTLNKPTTRAAADRARHVFAEASKLAADLLRTPDDSR